MVRLASWWVICSAAYLVFAASLAPHELLLAALTGAIAATAVVLAHGADDVSFAPPVRDVLRGLAHLPSGLTVETALLLGPHLVATLRGRARPGRFLRFAMDAGDETASDAGRRAFFLNVAALTPNAVPLFIDRDTRQVVVHQLVHRREPNTEDVRFPA